MFNKIIIVSAIITISMAQNVSAQESIGFSGISITDFSLHKVLRPKPKSENKEIITEPTQKTVKAPENPKPQTKVPKIINKQKSKPKIFHSGSTIKNKLSSQLIKSDNKNYNGYSFQEKPFQTKNNKLKLSENKPQKENFDSEEYLEKVNSYEDKFKSNAEAEIKPSKKEIKDDLMTPFKALSIVLLLIFGLAWLVDKKFRKGALFSGKINGIDLNKFKIVTSSQLGQGKLIHLVEINGKQLVIGSTNNNINLLTEINPEDIEILKPKVSSKPKQAEISEEEDEIDYDPEHTPKDNYSANYADIYKDYLNKEKKKEEK